MAFKKGEQANPNGVHTPATRHIATSHKKVRAKGKQYLPDAVDNLITAVLDTKGNLTLAQKVAASKDLIKLVFEAEKYLERMMGVKPKDESSDEEEDDSDNVPYIKISQ